MKLSTKQIAHLRGLAHNLNPVVMIGNNGLTENVIKEIELNLNAHELIKVQVAGDDRAARKAIFDEIYKRSTIKLDPQTLFYEIANFKKIKE